MSSERVFPHPSQALAQRLAGNVRDRDERDRLKQRRMVEYAERRACRWTGVLDYFGQETIEKSRGHCDSCDQAAG